MPLSSVGAPSTCHSVPEPFLRRFETQSTLVLFAPSRVLRFSISIELVLREVCNRETFLMSFPPPSLLFPKTVESPLVVGRASELRGSLSPTAIGFVAKTGATDNFVIPFVVAEASEMVGVELSTYFLVAASWSAVGSAIFFIWEAFPSFPEDNTFFKEGIGMGTVPSIIPTI